MFYYFGGVSNPSFISLAHPLSSCSLESRHLDLLPNPLCLFPYLQNGVGGQKALTQNLAPRRLLTALSLKCSL